MSEFVIILLLAIPVASVAWTVTKEEVFREIREWCERWCENSKRQTGWRHLICRKVTYFPTCYICFSHWVALVALFLHPVKLVDIGWQGYVFAFFAITFIANTYLTIFHILRVLLRWVGDRKHNQGGAL